MTDLTTVETPIIDEQQAQELITQWLSRDQVVATTRRGIKKIVSDNGGKLISLFSDKNAHPERVLTEGLMARWKEFLGKREQQAKEELLTQEMGQLERDIPDLENEVNDIEQRLRRMEEEEQGLVTEIKDLEKSLKPKQEREESFKNQFCARKIESRDFPLRENILTETRKLFRTNYAIFPISESFFDGLFSGSEDQLKTIFSDFPEQGTEEEKKEWFVQKKRDFLEVFYRKLTSYQTDYDREDQVINQIVSQLGKENEYSNQRGLIEKIKDPDTKEAVLRRYHQEILFHFLLTHQNGDILKVFPDQQLLMVISETINEFDTKGKETAEALKERQKRLNEKKREKEETEAILAAKNGELEKKRKRKNELTEKGINAIQSLNLSDGINIQTIIQRELLRFKEKPPLNSYTVYDTSYERFIMFYAQEGWGAELVKDLLGENDSFLEIGGEAKPVSQWLGKALERFDHFLSFNIEGKAYFRDDLVKALDQILEALRSGREIRVITNPFSYKPLDPNLSASIGNVTQLKQQLVDSLRRTIQDNGLNENNCIVVGPLVLFPNNADVILSQQGLKHFGKFDGFLKESNPEKRTNFLNDQDGLFGFLWEQKAIGDFLLLV